MASPSTFRSSACTILVSASRIGPSSASSSSKAAFISCSSSA
ncbi:secreted protein [gut metagenome]|uniref:Secreted protein n=1 Tax=gut metagenome TaxID=749906 RepID=J9FTE8_9ZZZZ